MPRSAQTPRRTGPAGVLCSRDTAGSSPAAARQRPIGPGTGASALGPERGRSEPAGAAGAAARQAGPAQPHRAPCPPLTAPVRNGGSAGQGGRGLRAALPPCRATRGRRLQQRHSCSGDTAATAADEPPSSTVPRSVLRETLGVWPVKEQRRAAFIGASPRAGMEGPRRRSDPTPRQPGTLPGFWLGDGTKTPSSLVRPSAHYVLQPSR